MAQKMIVNYVPGEECRVAVVEDGRLQELQVEQMDAISHVGNIYVGRVSNVEASIQAAFVDFGLTENGFLHVTDLHPRYFPGEDEETTERVGKKTPRRDRPPIQRCLKKGQEITVQVLKEGVGSKGPTLTSYLSVPGRFLVMMPQMDRIGVSRKVEDDEARRAARLVLDDLELPEGFGFILRTAGMGRTKAEIKRDLAYLQRLWKDMERRLGQGSRPRILYSESDLLVRSLRDQLTGDINEIIIDNEQALARAHRFMKIVAPRTQTQLLRYEGGSPIFHAYGIEPQIQSMHSREVPLPSGGRLVIQETEALVAIDVNSGRSRAASDAETTAYKTNLEAADEICRQLRLRDLGGLVINDLIDMREARHRRAVEQRFRERLKHDRARTMILPISEFGILEMTRQRMRGSHGSTHFAECPGCRGRGLIQRPGSVASDALRSLAALLEHESVNRVELVVAPRVASELLSKRRQALGRIENASGRHVDVRVSETLPPDRVSFYAYDDTGADLDVEKLGKPAHPPKAEAWSPDGELPNWVVEVDQEEPEPVPAPAPAPPHTTSTDAALEDESAKKGRRRRRRRKKTTGTPAPEEQTPPAEEPAEPLRAEEGAADHKPQYKETPKKKRRRRRKKSEAGDEPAAQPDETPADAETPDDAGAPDPEATDESAEPHPAQPEPPRKKKKSRRRKKPSAQGAPPAPTAVEETREPERPPGEEQPQEKAGKKRRRRRRKKTATPMEQQQPGQADAAPEAPLPEPPASAPERPAPKPVRPLYASRRRLHRGQIDDTDDRP